MTESHNRTRVDIGKVLLLVALMLLPITAGRLVRAAVRQDVDPPSEVWTALAFDWHSGMPYRPALSDAGYGGSRYFPGHVALQAAAMSLLSPIASGFAVTALALVLFLLGGYRLLRDLGLSQAAAAGGASLALMSTPIQQAAVATRGDLLSAALALCGLCVAGVAVSTPASTRRLLLAGALFAASWFTKWTSVAAPLAAVIVFWSTARRRQAAILVGTCVASAGVFVILMQAATHGRFLEIFFLSATGRSTAADLVKAPYHLLLNFRESMGLTVPPTLLALGCLFHPEAPFRFRFLFVYAGAAFVVFAAVNMGYGAEHNHMIELEAASALALAAFAATGLLRRELGAVVLAACVLLVGTLLLSPDDGLLRRRVSPTRRAEYEEFLPAIKSRGPILSAYPLVPLLLGERPFLLDPWMFGVIESRRPGPAADLRDRLEHDYFGAVVVTGSPATVAGRREIDRWLGVGIGELIDARYSQIWSADSLYVLVARTKG